MLSSVCSDRLRRRVPVKVAQAVFPAIFLGFIVPSFLFSTRFGNISTQQSNFFANWNAHSVYCSLLTISIADTVQYLNRPKVGPESAKTGSTGDKGAKQDEDQDVGPLRTAYAFAFAFMAIAHVALLFMSYRSGLTFSDIFANLPSIFSDWTTFGDSVASSVILKYDMLIYVLAQYVYCVYVVVELRSKCPTISETTQVVPLSAPLPL